MASRSPEAAGGGDSSLAGEPEGRQRGRCRQPAEADHHSEAPVGDLHNRNVLDLLPCPLPIDGVVRQVGAIVRLVLVQQAVRRP